MGWSAGRRVSTGELAVDDLQIAAEQFLGGIVGHQQLRRALGQDPPDDAAIAARVDAAVTTFLTVHRPPRRGQAQASTSRGDTARLTSRPLVLSLDPRPAFSFSVWC